MIKPPSRISIPIGDRTHLPEFVAMHDADGKHVSYAVSGQEHLHVGLQKGDGMNVPEVVPKPKPNLPLKAEAFWNPAESKLELKVELLPVSELSHHQLAAMFDGKAEASAVFSDEGGILRATVTLEHTRNVAKDGKVAHDEELAARDKGMTVPAYRQWKAAEDKKKADAGKAQEAAKKADAPTK